MTYQENKKDSKFQIGLIFVFNKEKSGSHYIRLQYNYSLVECLFFWRNYRFAGNNSQVSRRQTDKSTLKEKVMQRVLNLAASN